MALILCNLRLKCSMRVRNTLLLAHGKKISSLELLHKLLDPVLLEMEKKGYKGGSIMVGVDEEVLGIYH